MSGPKIIATAIKIIREKSGGLDILVNYAGIFLELDYSLNGNSAAFARTLDAERFHRTYEMTVSVSYIRPSPSADPAESARLGVLSDQRTCD